MTHLAGGGFVADKFGANLLMVLSHRNMLRFSVIYHNRSLVLFGFFGRNSFCATLSPRPSGCSWDFWSGKYWWVDL